MKALISLIITGALVISGYSQTRNVLVGTNNAVVQPTNFWSADASNARTGLGLGTASTNPSSAFQPASSVLSNLVSGASYPTFQISNISGLQTSLDSKLSITGNAVNLTNFPASLLRSTGDASGLTNFPTLNQNTTGTASNVTGVVAIANGGTGTNSTIGARQNLGLVWTGLTNTNADTFRVGLGATTVGSSLFTLANPSAIRFLRFNADNTVSALSDSDFRTAIGLNTASTNPASAFQPASSSLTNLAANNGASLTNIPLAGVIGALATNGSAAGLTNFPASLLVTNGNGAGLTNLTAANITGTVALASNVTGTIAISNGGSGATTAGGARTNLGLGATNSVTFNTVTTERLDYGTNYIISLLNQELYSDGQAIIAWATNQVEINSPITFLNSNVISTTRTNLGLGWSALTNTTASGFQTALFGANTNPVLVNTNGEVVSPTNFWQTAPINTVLQNITNIVGNSTNAATNARMLFLYSLAPTVTNVTSTITLPTNGSTFGGDVATITHLGPTSSVTAIRALGASTNIITLNQIEESVRFIYRDNQWKLMDNISYIEPIFFSGTNATANAAASRTNLGLGTTNNVEFNQATFNGAVTFNEDVYGSYFEATDGTNGVEFQSSGIVFTGTAVSTTRTNLGIPLAALTNTNAAGFQRAIFSTNTAPTNSANVNGIGFNTAVAWMEVSVITNGVTNSYRIPLFQ